MPPKKSRGGPRGGSRAASRTPGPRESTPFNPTLRSQQTPGPARFSTSYGSPAVLTGSRNFRSESAANAISNALDSVQAADREDRALRGSEEESEESPDEDDDDDVKAPQAAAPASRKLQNASSRAQRGDGGATDSSDTDEENDAARMPPPPPPSQQRTASRSASMVPPSDTRSFTEESALFSGAGLRTPRPASRSRRQETPSRVSARIAARNDGKGSQAGSVASSVASSVADSKNGDDDEDELAAAPAQAGQVQYPKISGSGVPRAYSPNIVERMDQAFRRPDVPRADVTRDEEEGTLRPQAQRNGTAQQQIRGPKAANPIGKVKLPIPINPHTGQPIGEAIPSEPLARPAPQLGPPGDPAPRRPRTSGVPIPGSLGRPQIPTPESSTHGLAQSARRPGDSQIPIGDQDTYYEYEYYEPESLPSVIKKGLDRIFHISKWPRWLLSGLQTWGLLTFFSMAFLIVLQVALPPARWEGVKVSRNYTYTGIGDWRQNIAQFVPWVILHPFAVLTGNLDYVDYRTALHWADWNHQNNKIRLDYLAAAVGQMRRILPELIAIKVDKSTNEWAAGDSFWIALDAKMKQDGLHHSILTLERSADGSYIITDNHWDAVLRRMQTEGMLISGQPEAGDGDVVHSDQINSIVERAVSQRWDQWLKTNDDAIKRLMGTDKEVLSAYYTELFGDFQQKMLDSIQSRNQEEQLVSREEFIEKIKHVSNEYDVQIKAEMAVMEDRLRHAIDIAEDGKQRASLPDGFDRKQVSDMIDVGIKRAIADAQLEFIAKGNIKGHLETELSGRKNYFSAIRGAIVDHTLSSSSYTWESRGITGDDGFDFGSLFSIFSRQKPVFREGGQQARIAYNRGMALEKWDEDGECWCAGHSDTNNASRVADLSILTADTVIPQHLVVEHIAASGSFDPEAMPKDLEVWIRTPSDRRRRSLLEWSASIWSDAKFGAGARLMAKGFVKIGEFEYLNGVSKGEKQVFRLSEDLIGLDAQTQQVLVRSKSNYGAKDHTCFYRLQLFGEEGKSVDRSAVE